VFVFIFFCPLFIIFRDEDLIGLILYSLVIIQTYRFVERKIISVLVSFTLEHLFLLAAKTLLDILQCISNIKVLNLSDLKLKLTVSDNNSTLRPLRHFLHIGCTIIRMESSPEGFNEIWILEPYTNQIVSVETTSTEWLRPDAIVLLKLEL